MNIDAEKYPIGLFIKPDIINAEHIEDWILSIKKFPSELNALICSEKPDLNWQYRDNGWSIQHVIHHCADSHMNSFIRFKWALTEDNPVIKAYNEQDWAQLPDTLEGDVEWSIQLLMALHRKWVFLLRQLSPASLDKTFVHPETKRQYTIKENIGIYAWHGEHHIAHIRLAILKNS